MMLKVILNCCLIFISSFASAQEVKNLLEEKVPEQFGNQVLVKIKPGDFVFIPKNTVHELTITSEKPMRVISIQAPFFDGSDRVMISPGKKD